MSQMVREIAERIQAHDFFLDGLDSEDVSHICQLAAYVLASTEPLGDEKKSAANIEGDNLCWFDSLPANAKIPPREEFLESCSRFHQQISQTNGVLSGCKTIAQLESDNANLRAQLRAAEHNREFVGKGQLKILLDACKLADPDCVFGYSGLEILPEEAARTINNIHAKLIAARQRIQSGNRAMEEIFRERNKERYPNEETVQILLDAKDRWMARALDAEKLADERGREVERLRVALEPFNKAFLERTMDGFWYADILIALRFCREAHAVLSTPAATET